MGFWSTVGELLVAVGNMSEEATSDAAKLSTETICSKLGSVNVITNPLIFGALHNELCRRAKQMSKRELLSYYDEYDNVSDVSEILEQEMERRGIAY